jgi:hypothetical protein
MNEWSVPMPRQRALAGVAIPRALLIVSLLALLALLPGSATAEPIPPPASLMPPLPPNAIDARCVETGIGIRCTYEQVFPAEPAPHTFVDCGSLTVFEQGVGIRASVTRYYDLSGGLIQEVRRVSYGGVLTTAAQPAGIGSREGQFTVTLDFEAGVLAQLTYKGLTAQVQIDGHGVVALDAGRVVIAPIGPGAFAVVSAVGRHDFIFPGLFGPGFNLQNAPPNIQGICDALV